MRCACIDIGSNTTRVLVADVTADGLREVACEKAFTRLGVALRRDGELPAEALERVAETVAAQVRVSRELGAQRTRVVATAAIRAARNAPELIAAVRARAGVEVEVLDGDEEARLAFSGATYGGDWPGAVAVVDVGGGSTEIAVGEPGAGVRWAVSMPIGSSSLTEAGGVPAEGARAALAGLRPPPAQAAVAVGGSATSTARLVGPRIDAATAQVALDALRDGRAHGLEPERAQLLPAGLAILVAVSELLGLPLQVGAGGLREGVCRKLAGFTASG